MHVKPSLDWSISHTPIVENVGWQRTGWGAFPDLLSMFPNLCAFKFLLLVVD